VSLAESFPEVTLGPVAASVNTRTAIFRNRAFPCVCERGKPGERTRKTRPRRISADV